MDPKLNLGMNPIKANLPGRPVECNLIIFNSEQFLEKVILVNHKKWLK